MEGYQNPPISFEYRNDELGVTNVKDLEGTTRVLSFLRLEGRKQIDIRYTGGTADKRQGTFLDEHFLGDLILFGSPASNKLTKGQLGDKSYHFSNDWMAIIDPENQQVYKRDRSVDYAILAKRVDHEGRIRFVLAGIGPSGTAAAAVFLTNPHCYSRLARKYRKNEFTILLKLTDGNIYQAEPVLPDLLR